MADTSFSRLEAFAVVIPKATPIAAPVEVATGWNPGELAGVELILPAGLAYNVGLRLLLAHAQAFPTTQGSWLVGNDEKIDWSTAGYPNSGAWSVQGYNLSQYDHTIQVRYKVADFALSRNEFETQPVATPLVV